MCVCDGYRHEGSSREGAGIMIVLVMIVGLGRVESIIINHVDYE